jgi:TAG lipase / steryl ester hydrolase / phospholipase A2 / LPA acyltransferase
MSTMDDLLVPKVPTIRVRAAEVDSRTKSKPLRIATEPPTTQQVALGTLSRAVKGANNLLLSLRDGLNESERQQQRNVDERKQILALRMKNVGSLLFPSRTLQTSADQAGR